jgi:hypothetical protein
VTFRALFVAPEGASARLEQRERGVVAEAPTELLQHVGGEADARLLDPRAPPVLEDRLGGRLDLVEQDVAEPQVELAPLRLPPLRVLDRGRT